MYPKQLAETLEHMVNHREPVLIKGQPGVGKTDIVKQVAEKLECDLIVTHPVVDDPIDYKGLPFHVDGEAQFLPIGNLNKLVKADKPTVMFLDDLGQAPPAVQAAAMQLLLARSINEHKVPDYVTFIAATNRKEDRAGVAGILEPVKSRFATIVELEPNIDDWTDWASNQGDMPIELIAFMQYRPGLIREFEATADITNTPCPRTIAAVGRILNQGMPPSLRSEVISGAAGEGFASEIEGFLQVYEKMPNPKDVLKDPKKHNLERIDDTATIYALVMGLSEYVDHKNFKNYVDALSYFDVEYQTVSIRMALRKDMSLSSEPAIVDWLDKNSNMLL